MKKLIDHFNNSNSPKQFSIKYVEYLTEILKTLNFETIEIIIEKFLETTEKGSTIYYIANGGSAATATHFANDISIGTYLNNHIPIKSVSLCDNLSVLTAVGNDYGYEDIFLKQLEVLLSKEDILLALSVSGNSENIIKAVNYAKSIGSITIGCTGFNGGELKSLVDINLHIPTYKGEYGPVEDVFMILDHIIYSYIKIFNFL